MLILNSPCLALEKFFQPEQKRLLKSLGAGLKFPPLSFRVNEVRGNPYKLSEEGEKWEPIEPGALLTPHTRISTLDEDSVVIEVAGISYLQLNEASEIKLGELHRQKMIEDYDEGLIRRRHEKNYNKIDLDLYHGELDQTLRRHEKQEIDYEVNTPQATLGIRGTSFTCRVGEEGTESAVLEGKVEFIPKGGIGIELGPGLISKVRRGETTPQQSEALDEKRRKEMEKVRKKAEKALLLEPEITPENVAGRRIQETDSGVFNVQLDHYFSRTFQVKGTAQALEPGQKISNLEIRREGETIPVKGLQEWSFEVIADTLPVGLMETVPLQMRAIDDTGTKSDTLELTLTLRHPDAREILPTDYKPGTTTIELQELGNRNVTAAEFPFQLYFDDLSETDFIIIRGKAAADTAIEGVAYSLNRGISWQPARGDSQWEFKIPLDDKHDFVFTPKIIAWTSDKKIGKSTRLPTFKINESTFDKQMEKLMEEYLLGLYSSNIESSLELHTPDFQWLVEEPDTIKGNQELKDLLTETVKISEKTQIFTSLLEKDIGPRNARVSLELQIYGRHKPTGRWYTSFSSPVEFLWERIPTGQFRLQQLRHFPHEHYVYNAKPIVAKDPSGISLEIFDTTPVNKGELKIELKYDSWVVSINREKADGGIFKLNTDKVSDAFPVPAHGSVVYQQTQILETEHLYAFAFEDKKGNQKIGLLRPIKDDKKKIFLELLFYEDLLQKSDDN
ncbi:MAG: FecR domain-containing protein [bacterium]